MGRIHHFVFKGCFIRRMRVSYVTLPAREDEGRISRNCSADEPEPLLFEEKLPLLPVEEEPLLPLEEELRLLPLEEGPLLALEEEL